MSILLDNTVLSNFAITQRPDVISVTLEKLAATTGEVMHEQNEGVKLGRIPQTDWSWLPLLSLTPSAQSLCAQLRLRLGPGEASCIALAHYDDHQVMTDDRVARRLAQQLQVPVSGTLGLLALAVDKECLSLSAADGLLQQMITAGYRSPISSLQGIVARSSRP